MNIEQIKADLDNNVIVSRQTWHKLVEAARIMQKDLSLISKFGEHADSEHSAGLACATLLSVEAL